jgi:homoserine dehydrogenase
VALNFEAAVGGAIPIVKTLREGLTGNSLARIYGILNGTCNYILTRMEQEKLAFADCLKEAQRLGYAEADPTFDIEGHDTAQKLAILASLAFGTKVDQSAVYVEGISSIASEDLEWADELGYRVKLLGVAVRTEKGIEQRVHPTMVPKDTAIAQVMGVTNAVTVDADAITPITLVGPGAGGMATASSVVSDIGDIARGVRTAPFGRPAGGSPSARKRRCNATRVAITSVCWRWTSRVPPPPSQNVLRSKTSRSSRSSSVTAASDPMAEKLRGVPASPCR